MKRVLGLVAILVVAAIIIAVPVFASGCSSDAAYVGRMAQQFDGRGQGDLQRDGDRDGDCLMQGGGRGRGMFDRSDSTDCDGDCEQGTGIDCPGRGDGDCDCDGDCEQGTGIDCPGRGYGDGDCDGDCLESTSADEIISL